jgi:RNA polymerase sigma-70 factor (sigma-E family)
VGAPLTEDDERDFREFARARMDHLRGLAYLTCGDWHSAEDAVSTAMARLYVHWAKVDNPDAYARTCVVHAAIDERRRPWRRERASSDGMPDPPGPDPVSALDDRGYLMAALNRIPRGQRAVVVLRFYEGLSIEEVAGVLGRSTGTVKSQASRGLAALRALLTTDGPKDLLDRVGGNW